MPSVLPPPPAHTLHIRSTNLNARISVRCVLGRTAAPEEDQCELVGYMHPWTHHCIRGNCVRTPKFFFLSIGPQNRPLPPSVVVMYVTGPWYGHCPSLRSHRYYPNPKFRQFSQTLFIYIFVHNNAYIAISNFSCDWKLQPYSIFEQEDATGHEKSCPPY